MRSFLGRMFREHGRQITPAGAPNRVTTPPPASLTASTVVPATLVTTEGTGVDLLILGVDELESANHYLGDEPIEEDF